MDQLAKASRQAALASLLGFLVVASSLIYSAVKLHSSYKELRSLQEEAGKAQQKRDDLLREIESLNQQIASKVKIFQRLEIVNPKLAEEVVPNPDQEKNAMSAQVYIFTSDQSQNTTAQQIAETLKAKGFNVPGIENQQDEETPPPETQVRFFRYPEDKREAQVIVDILKNSFGMSASRTAYVLPENAGATEPRQFEVFFKKNPL